LQAEVCYLHRQLFHRAPNDGLVSAYLRVHADLPELHSLDPQQLHTVRTVVTRRLDALGIEPWLRDKSKKRHALSVKLLLLSYLAETDASHPEYTRHGRVVQGVWACMLLTTLSAVFRLLRGRVQAARHGLV
jgi:hypothetical protein